MTGRRVVPRRGPPRASEPPAVGGPAGRRHPRGARPSAPASAHQTSRRCAHRRPPRHAVRHRSPSPAPTRAEARRCSRQRATVHRSPTPTQEGRARHRRRGHRTAADRHQRPTAQGRVGRRPRSLRSSARRSPHTARPPGCRLGPTLERPLSVRRRPGQCRSRRGGARCAELGDSPPMPWPDRRAVVALSHLFVAFRCF